jgi:hypothetical protein
VYGEVLAVRLSYLPKALLWLEVAGRFATAAPGTSEWPDDEDEECV